MIGLFLSLLLLVAVYAAASNGTPTWSTDQDGVFVASLAAGTALVFGIMLML